jgi:CRP-like cAMP-binding protein
MSNKSKRMLEPAQVVNLLKKQPELLTFTPGDLIFKEGDTGEVMYGIIEGEVEMTLNDKQIETLKEGDVFGEGALVHYNHLRTSTATAKTDVKLAFLDRERFLFAVQENPVFALEVMRSYSDRFRHLKEKFSGI